MKTSTVIYPFLMAVIFMHCRLALGQQRYAVQGKVMAGQAPIPGASVWLSETRQGALSQQEGDFILQDVQPGTYTIYVSFVGYTPYTGRIAVPLTGPLNVQLLEAVQHLDEVVVVGDVFRQTQRESSVVMEKITAQEIAKQAGTTLMTSLERLPGVSSINMGVGVSKPVIRGMSFNRVVVNDSGIKQEGQQWGSDHGLEIDQFNVENIEIIRGPASLAYGSDALGGVLNILHPVMKLNGEHAAGADLLYRSNNGTAGATVSATGNHSGLVYKIRATRLEYGDYKVPAVEFKYNRFVLPIYDRALKNTAGNELHGSVLVGMQKNWGYSHLTVSSYNQDAGIFSGAIGIPRAYQLTPDGDSRNIDLPSQAVNHVKVISNSSIKLGNNWLELDAGYQKNIRKEYSFPHAHGSGNEQFGNLALRLDLHTITVNARYYAGQRRHQNIAGIQSTLQKNRVTGHEFLIPDYDAWQAAGFWLHKYKASEKIVLNAGVRADVAAVQAPLVMRPFYSSQQFIDSIQRSPAIDRRFINYSAGIGMSWMRDVAHTFKLNFGKTYRVPVAAELTANGVHHGASSRYEVGDAGLNPEEGFQFDAAWVYSAGRTSVTISPFFNYFKNYIYLSPSGVFPTVEIDGRLYDIADAGQLYAFRQTEALHTGGEIEVAWRAMKGLMLSVNGEYVRAQNLATDLPLPFTPPASLQFISDFVLPCWKILRNPFINLNTGYYFSQHRVERNEPATDGYALVNFAAGFGVGRHDGWLNVCVNIQNVLDTKYMNHLSRYRMLNLPEPGRSFMLTVGFKIEKKA